VIPKEKHVKVGDIVVVPKHGGQTLIHSGDVYQVFSPQEIYGILHDEIEEDCK